MPPPVPRNAEKYRRLYRGEDTRRPRSRHLWYRGPLFSTTILKTGTEAGFSRHGATKRALGQHSSRASASRHITMRTTSWMSCSMGMGFSSAVQVRMVARMPESREVELAYYASRLFVELGGRQEEAVHERADDFLEASREGRVPVRAEQHARVVARALRKAQDEPHVLREVEFIALEQAFVYQALDVAEHCALNLLKKLVDVVIVEVEGRAVVAGAVRDLAHGDFLHGLLDIELPERLAKVGASLLGDLRLLLHDVLQSRE